MESVGTVDAIGALEQALDELAAIDVSTLTVGEIEDMHVRLDVLGARLAGVHARIAAAFDASKIWAADGHRGAGAWLAHRRKRAKGRCRAEMWLARRLLHMPGTDEALTAGTLSVEHARELAACHDFSPEHFADDESFLVGAASAQTSFENFLRVLARWRDAVDHHRDDKRARRQLEGRRLILHRRPDGTVVILDGELDPIGGEAFLNALERIEQELFEQDWAEAKERVGDDVSLTDLRRTKAQRNADALAEMAHRAMTAPADGQRPDPLVSVYVDYETAAERLCELGSGVPLTPNQVAPLVPLSVFERIVFGPGNRVIELGLRQRFYTGGLRRAIELRDRHCQWPGCTVPAPRCQVDHRREYAKGGCTTQWNGRLLCEYHNRVRNRLAKLPPGWEPDDGEDDPDHLRELIRQRVRQLAAA
jgi:hypothetical protein